MPIPFYRPLPAPSNISTDEVLPEGKAGFFSRAVFQWATPIMKIGYSRPLEAQDLWTLPDELQCQNIANHLQNHLDSDNVTTQSVIVTDDSPKVVNGQRRSELARNDRFPSYSSRAYFQQARESLALSLPHGIDEYAVEHPSLALESELSTTDTFGENNKMEEKTKKEKENEKERTDTTLIWAMYRVVRQKWWIAILLKGFAAGLQITAPILTKLLIEQITLAQQSHTGDTDPAEQLEPKAIGYSIGLAFALFGMLQIASLCSYHALQKGSIIGFMMRAALIDLISRKSMRLSSRSKVEMTNGRLTTMVSADASFLDFSAPMTLDLVVQPVQILVGLGLLIWTLGYSALVGLAVLALAGPIQAYMFSRMVRTRRSQLTYVDSRVRLLSEVMTNIRSIKLFAYVSFFSSKISEMRKNELVYLRRNGFNRAGMNALMAFIPTLAAVLTFVTYGLSGHRLDAATIFSGLQYFNVLKTPISFLPMCFTAVSDALVGIGRISKLLKAEQIPEHLNIDLSAKYALDIQGDFQFEALPEQEEPSPSPTSESRKKNLEVEPFALRGIELQIPRGALVCIVGKIASGKSALLSGLLGEMRQLKGHTTFGGDIAYVPQQAWIHSGSIRDNITFSSAAKDIKAGRLSEVIRACALRADLRNMPNGDLTDVGEKGLSLSGGQRQRLSIARAAYANSSIILLDDPLSALDPNVAHHIVEECILSGPLAGRTRVIVTHNIELLSKSDWVVVMDRDAAGEGRIVQQGSFETIRRREGLFRTLIEEHSTQAQVTPRTFSQPESPKANAEAQSTEKANAEGVEQMLGTEEERETGAISWSVYIAYLKAIGSTTWIIAIVMMLLMTQVTSVANSLVLGFWSAGEFGMSQGAYMAIYAGLGLAIGFFTWAASYSMFLAGIRASYALFAQAWEKVVRSPTRWHDQTPSGRIISRLSKDVEMLDDRMAFAWETLLVNALAAVGTFGLVVYTYPWLGLAFIPLSYFYWLCGNFYRQTSREIKRIDSISRSAIYSSFGEQLAGSSVIRAFGKQLSFQDRMQRAINVEGQACILTLVIQRWLGVRLGLSANLLVLLIAIMGIAFRTSVDAAKFGVVFSYAIGATSLFANLVSLYAQVELEMNNAERIMHYTNLPSESPPILATDPPPSLWPSIGALSFKNVSLSYGSKLPNILVDLSFDIKPGEKVGVIGRTGAGKSSLVNAIMRMVEYRGEIEVDGVSLKNVGIDTLRMRIGIIPQDPLLFEGTVRSNIDPMSQRSDAHLKALLKLVKPSDPNLHTRTDTLGLGGTSQPQPQPQPQGVKFALESKVAHEGSNFSAGEKQLLALVRALARETKLLVMDEATSSVDPQTDGIVQRVIQDHLHGVTLLTIAHRLETVAYHDRILVLDAGRVAEFDTPLALFDNRDSIFRQLCDRVHLSRPDLLRLRHDALHAHETKRDLYSLYGHYDIAQAWADGGIRVSEYLH